ncbi:MAG: conjugal transfer protein [Egibacteraceae bacterium]
MTGTTHDAAASVEPGPRRAPRVPSLLLTRLLHVVLWLLVAVAASAGIASLLLHASSDTATAAVQLPADTTAAEATAEVFLWAYLGGAGRGQEAAVEPFLAQPVDLRAVTPGSQYVLRTAVVASDEQAPGYWAVTVAADTLAADAGGYEPQGVRYYTVGVFDSPGGLAVTGPPSLMAAPPSAGEPARLAVTSLGRPEPGEALEAAERFLRAYLAGDGEVDRYTAPGLDLVAVSPPAYVEVVVQRAGLVRRRAGGVLLRLEVAATDDAGRTAVLGYSLDVVERAGRWEVTTVHPAAPLSAPAT